MKARFLTLWGKVVAAIVSVFGMYGCDIHAVDYGCPYAEFSLKGTVVDEKDTPIEGIRVAVEVWNVDGKDIRKMYNDTLYTNAEGKVSFMPSHDYFFYPPDSVSVAMEDVDGEDNDGDFKSQIISPEVVQIEKGDGVWFEGRYESSFNAKLQKK